MNFKEKYDSIIKYIENKVHDKSNGRYLSVREIVTDTGKITTRLDPRCEYYIAD